MKILERRLKNGTKCYIICKKGFKTKQAMLSVNFGAAEEGLIPGLAHFIEHKVFEQKNLDVFGEFSKNGAEVNAFTNFNTTAYYFTCCDKLKENLKTLIEFTANPYFTDESTEREKDIISQEIRMYDDDPWWQVYFNLIKAMYSKNPVRNSIAGSVEDIKGINADMLKENYDKFYCGENSALVICGDLKADEIMDYVDNIISMKKGQGKIKAKDFEDNIAEKHTSVTMNVSKPVFSFGFKEKDFSLTPAERLCGSRILMNIILGESSELYGELYYKGLIDRDFSMEYLLGGTFGGMIFSGVSEDVYEILSLLKKKIGELRARGIDEEEFKRSVGKLKGLFLKGFNSIEGITAAQTDYAFKNIRFSDVYKTYSEITKEKVSERLSLFSEENMAVSLVEPFG